MATFVIAAVASVPVIIVLLLARRTDIISYIVAGVAVIIARHNILFMERLEVDWLIVTAGAVAGVVFWALLRKMAPQPAKADAE